MPKIEIKACPFDGNTKFRQVGIDGSSAKECLKCHHVLVLRPHEDGSFHRWRIYAYSDVMSAASEQPMEFQTSMF
jgi:hypothetical protein